jgi:hypothetical protein
MVIQFGGLRVWGGGFWGFGVYGQGFRFHGSEVGVQCIGFKLWVLSYRFRVWSLGFRV